ncbi:pentapeptide repeat-containing protein [Nodosilinea sp. LEGE 06152]|uniref:pentapeptide repeat-containing protein n=1 Tax=Nodosilinea sp. LEGE 06152 TaxID=2777966 RepID=UPI0018823D25|nr:pentapeptide repeat-containing protein [Nodosilinea sp. LEGE 06152]MBE9156831.1 pentapeptide repeat-containing protein [Nodosilinea sp. LEGE 06152]
MSGITPKKPTSIWKRPLQVKFGDLATALGKVAITGSFGLWPETASGGVDILAALGIQGDEVGAIAWMLVQRSLLQAMSELTGECKTDLIDKSPNFKLLCEQLDHALENSELSLDPKFFNRPKQLPVVEEVKAPFRQWLQTYGLSPQQAQSLADRLPRYFVFALNEQWRANPTDYVLLQQSLGGPFEAANERELAWMRYAAWLQRRVDEPMFAEAFGLRQVYIPLRAYYECKIEPSKSDDLYYSATRQDETTLRFVVDLQTAVLDWLDKAEKDDAIRIICGGPGCGKSSFGRMLAAYLTETEKLPVLFIPLHQFDPSGDLVDALNNFLRTDLDSILPPNPLKKGNSEQQLLLIFDGLDELAMQGKVAAQVAQDFVREVQKKLLAFNRTEARVFALISGRDPAIQTIKTEFRKVGQVLHVLPYFQTEEERRKHNYSKKEEEEQKLLQQDQRQTWWQTYGQLKGKDYAKMPEELNQGKLIEITAQPLLNYLVALSYDRNEINFSAESNLNIIYNDLLTQVYQRDWEGYKHPALGNIEKKDFIRILEEIAVACWHGNGRTATIRRIADRCASGTLKRVLEIFEGGANEGVTRLLTAFYFRQSDIQGSEATFEFTHKSFAEYLIARRIVLELNLIQEEFSRHCENIDVGWDEKECLKRWITLCGIIELDKYILIFLRAEVACQDISKILSWQKVLCEIFAFGLRYGMPMEYLKDRPGLLIEIQMSQNSEFALLACINACSRVSKVALKIDWPSSHCFSKWIRIIQAQSSKYNPKSIIRDCLNYLDFHGCNLSGLNLTSFNLEGSIFEMAQFNNSNLEGVNLTHANLAKASFCEANLSNSILRNAKMNGVDLSEAILRSADFGLSNLENSILCGSDISYARMNHTNLTNVDFGASNASGTDFLHADLTNATFTGSKLSYSNFSFCKLDGVSFAQANLQEAIFFNVDLSKTDGLTLGEMINEDSPYICKSKMPINLQSSFDENLMVERFLRLMVDHKVFYNQEEAKNFLLD